MGLDSLKADTARIFELGRGVAAGDCKIATVKEANSEPERTRREQNSQSLECFVQGLLEGAVQSRERAPEPEDKMVQNA